MSLCVFNCVSLCQILKTASQQPIRQGVQSVVSIKVTSDIKAFCNASNEYGADVVTFNIKASEFLLQLGLFRLGSSCLNVYTSFFSVTGCVSDRSD